MFLRTAAYVVVLSASFTFAGCAERLQQETFCYVQDFSCVQRDPDHAGRLVFADVREENLLSSWKEPNWVLTDGGVRVVGSRRAEVKRREEIVRERYQGNESSVIIRGYRVPWLTLAMGDTDWTDIVATTTVRPGKDCSAGLAFRYQNPRQYYVFLLEDTGKVSLCLRTQDREATPEDQAWQCLKSAPFNVTPEKAYDVRITANGPHLSCAVDGHVLIEVTDATLSSGRIALIADNPALFGHVNVQGRLVRPELPPLPSCAQPQLLHKVAFPPAEERLDVYLFDVDTDGQREIVIAEKNGDRYGYRCIEFTGEQLWNINHIRNRTTEGGDRPFQVFDINGDKKNEFVFAADFQIEIRDGRTENPLRSQSTPQPNPYDDSRDYEYLRLLGDALCPVRLAPDEPPGLYIKDRYTNIWIYDHKFNLQWHKALSTGHFPLPVDLDDDGADELMVCHTLLRGDGSQAWRLPLSDHVDAMAYVSLHPPHKPKRIYQASGEMGLLEVDPQSGALLQRHELGHVQRITIADFLPDRPGLELLAQTFWREDRLHYVFDKDLRLLATWLAPALRIFPLPWGENGRDLFLNSNGVFDPLTGRRILPPLGGRIIEVLDDDRWGNGVVVTQDGDQVKVYGPQEGFAAPPRKRLYQDLNSHYLPEVSLPAR